METNSLQRSFDAAKRLAEDLPKSIDPRRSISERLASARSCTSALDEHTHELVIQARDEGLSWQSVGEILGLTKQAAQKRFGGS